MKRSASKNAWTRTSGCAVSMSGTLPAVRDRSRSHTASLIRNVMKSRLRSGLPIAETFTRRVSRGSKCFAHGTDLHRAIDVLLAPIGPVAELPQHAARDAALQIDAIAEREIALKANSAFGRHDGLRAQLRSVRRAVPPPVRADRVRRIAPERLRGFAGSTLVGARGGHYSGRNTSSSSLRRWLR